MVEAVIVASRRTPIGRAFKGSLAPMRADDLTASVIRPMLERVPAFDPQLIDDLILGCGMPGGEQGSNLARVVAVLLGRDDLPGTTVTRYCASSLQSARMAFHAIRAGEGEAFISAGAEMVSSFVKGSSDEIPGQDLKNSLFAQASARTTSRMQSVPIMPWTDPRLAGELPDMYAAMGATAENVASILGISREAQDAYAAESQRRAAAAMDRGFWRHEIEPITLPDGRVMTDDESPRPGTTAEKLAELTPAFSAGGTVTAGNACPLNDGAAALLITSDTLAARSGLAPRARILSSAVTGISPEIMGLGPVEAIRLAVDRAHLTLSDVDIFEINEAFAAQVLGCAAQLDIPADRLNVNGGAIAIGHPFGMTGARMLGTLISALEERGERIGVASMCIAGGMGMAMVIEVLP